MGASYTLLGVVVLLAALLFHNRLDVAQRVHEAFPGEPSELRPVVWANALQRLGGSGNQGACCYAADWKKLGAIFCGAGVGVGPDAIPMLGHCTAYIQGRTEFPIKSFRRGGYAGNLTQRRDGVYLIKEIEVRSDGAEDDASCRAIKGCSAAKGGDSHCRELRKRLEEWC
ncbi:unnamed protein product [Prorocentrum cordatum]|uniref:Uncharacterized protein n=1 Tax=Prorocentrum cordatum TaxID=2364126 RepID=A0ABN9QN27_9DINO|nr:unnamed protein product [Polarella glacialis]|mmetsp:Transcript_99377/g.270180  ORF Transcript_99377/g.270180 Transcript_99377/m.270180 type:complete len:170 (-) Transcript_99377:98-607(-)